jgi:hypothetical protein
MNNEKNQLATLSPSQSNPYTAMPEDFEIVRDDDEIFTGQRSDKLQKLSEAQCKRSPSKRSPATETSDAAPSQTGRL